MVNFKGSKIVIKNVIKNVIRRTKKWKTLQEQILF